MRDQHGSAGADQENRRMVGVAEYAALRGLSERTVYRYLNLGLIPGAQQPAPGLAHRIPV